MNSDVTKLTDNDISVNKYNVWKSHVPDNWKYLTLSDLVSEIVDNRGRSAPLSENGIALIATNCIKNNGLYPTRENIRYVSEETYKTWFRSHPQPRDIIIVNKGTPGLVCQVPDLVDFCIAQDMVALRPNKKIVDGEYLLAALRSPFFLDQVHAFTVGTTIPHLKKGDFSKLLIPVPPMNDQNIIGKLYCDLSRKIELNRQMNETLEDIARALFKSWFVDFDPVRAKMEGRQPYGMDAETAELFPDGFEDSRIGKIPREWKVKSLNDCTSYLSRGVAPSYVDKSPIHALNQRAIRWWNIDETALKFHNPEKLVRDEAYIRKGDIVINSTGDGTIGRAYWFFHAISHLFADSHVSIARMLPDILLPEMVTFYMETPAYQDIIYGHVTGSTGQLELNRNNLGQIPFICAPIQLQRTFSSQIAPLFALIHSNQQQLKTLTILRDTLLPKLLSGEVSVKDAEKEVEAAL